MARQPRIDLEGHTYHVINRSSGRVPIFKTQKDYQAFEQVLAEAHERVPIDIFSYCVMPNHFHFALRPLQDGDMQRFMGWLTKTHTQRWHVAHDTTGFGHLYQGRYKSFIVDTDSYYLTLMQYIEQNPLRAKLIKRSADWKWGSLHRRMHRTLDQQKLLAPWPIDMPKDYCARIDSQPLKTDTLELVRASINKGTPLGGEIWRNALIEQLGLGHTLRSVGRPKNGS